MNSIELVIIGGGSAGLSAAIEAYNNGIEDILIIEQDKELGGILNQCIHNGFGLHWFKEELCGPQFAQRLINQVEELKINYLLNTTVLQLLENKVVEISNKDGVQHIQAKSIILAVGCYERNRGAISIPGTRPKGVFTAGNAQKYLNMDGYLVGKKVFILGSGDIGLIMARRMALEGAEVLGVAELMPYSNGLKRNIVQCLHDFEIPLYLSHTVTDIIGEDNLEKIVISKVDEHLQPIEGTQKEFEVDTLLLSVGLIPENSLLTNLGIELDPRTKGPYVDETLMVTDGIFACGNGLEVHDLVDYVAKEATLAGANAASYIKGDIITGDTFNVVVGEGLGYVLPHKVHVNGEGFRLATRVRQPMPKAEIVFRSNGTIIKKIKKINLFPAEMIMIDIKKEVIDQVTGTLEIGVVAYE